MTSLLLSAMLAASPWQKLPLVHDWFGVYLQGKKVGFMETSRERVAGADGEELRTSQKMTARVAGMGQTVEVTVTNTYAYDWKTGKLLRGSFEQSSPTGSVTVKTLAKGDKMDVEFAAGGEKRALPPQPAETIDSHQAGELMAASGAKIGTKKTVKVFDASIQKTTQVEYTVTKIDKMLLDGVEVPVRHVGSKMIDLNVEEEGVYTPEGRVLEARIAGLFTMRLEDEQRAKNLDYSQDVLVTFVVPVDKPIDNPYRLNELNVTFGGAGNFVMPKSDRQMVEKKGEALNVMVKRAKFDDSKAAQLPISGFKNELQAEALLQSDAPEIKKLAAELVGGEKNSFRAAKKLLEWVNTRVEKAYVPAVSNALEVYKSRKGDCGEHTALFVALARAAGIPARPVVGITYWPPGNGFGYHAWAEIYVGEWLAVDPTQGTMSADATHIQLAGGDLAEQAKITMLIGKLKATIEKAL